MKCPRCGAAIAREALLPGQRIVCPGCGKRLKLPGEASPQMESFPTPSLQTASPQTEDVPETVVGGESDGYSLAAAERPAPPQQEKKPPNGLSPKPPSSKRASPPKKSAKKSQSNQKSSSRWMWIAGGVVVTLCLLSGAVATAVWLIRPVAPPRVCRRIFRWDSSCSPRGSS